MGQENLFGESAEGNSEQAPPFEKVMAELEGIVEQLEAGDLLLEDSLDAFERGMKLSKQAEKRLDMAEQRVERLVSGAEGATTVPFDEGA